MPRSLATYPIFLIDLRNARRTCCRRFGVVLRYFAGARQNYLQAASPAGKRTLIATSGCLIVRASIRKAVELRILPREQAASFLRLTREPPAAMIFVPISASDGERLGTLCLARQKKTVTDGEKRLLEALASHAALSLENFRRFSQLERSKRQWVEDIDAISDYIVVHDRAWNIVRTNRSLASHLGVPPVALVGEAMISLRQIAETGSALPCPFCRDTLQAREEYVAASAEKIFLVSTSRTPSVADDDARTIHVLKDITDRREAERRYRELFDSIQEGLFFATPEGRFLDVNDAMVRMLGYESREELLRADVSTHLYPAPESRERFLQALTKRGVLRNYEETLRRRDGTLLHTLQNISGVRDARGRIVQIRGLMLDVTEQKTFQSQLQRERDFNQKILNTTQSMILVLDTAGLISYANRRCYEAGFQEEEVIGHRLIDWVDSSHREEFEAALETTAHGQQVENIELPVRRSDASMGHFSISLSPMRDEQNTVNSVGRGDDRHYGCRAAACQTGAQREDGHHRPPGVGRGARSEQSAGGDSRIYRSIAGKSRGAGVCARRSANYSAGNAADQRYRAGFVEFRAATAGAA